MTNNIKGARSGSKTIRFAPLLYQPLSLLSVAVAASLAATGHALAQASSPTGGIGAQMNLISGEAINSGGTAFGMACYLASAVCFGLGVWAMWQSKQPQNRESGMVGKGIAGLVLCGLFATAGTWVGKAAITASGGAATVNDAAAMVQFGAGGGAAAAQQ